MYIGELIELGATLTNPPSGTLFANGAAVSRSTYAALFAVIGTVFGVGDGSTTFNVPDKRGRVSIGAGQGSGLTNRTLGAIGGDEVITAVPEHSHLLKANSSAGGTGNPNGACLAADSTGSLYSSSAVNCSMKSDSIAESGDEEVDVMNPFVVCNFVIAYTGIDPLIS
jgi:microcystin-dependent protein